MVLFLPGEKNNGVKGRLDPICKWSNLPHLTPYVKEDINKGQKGRGPTQVSRPPSFFIHVTVVWIDFKRLKQVRHANIGDVSFSSIIIKIRFIIIISQVGKTKTY